MNNMKQYMSIVKKKDNRNCNEFVKPFLRWAGGKSKFIRMIVECFPPRDKIGTYYEPFLGAASSFLFYQPENAKLSDLNQELIDAFAAIKNNYKIIHRYLCDFVKKDSESFYYKIRDEYNRKEKSFRQVARFIYLNKTCFNGIFRVNRNGDYNVPYGYKENIVIPSLDHFSNVSKLLQNVELKSADYKISVISAKKNDLVYFDPPYPPINGSSYFTHYTKERFSESDQYELAETAFKLSNRGCFVVITNADKKEIKSLYKGWQIHSLMRTRSITSSKHKHKVGELIITNYDVKQRG